MSTGSMHELTISKRVDKSVYMIQGGFKDDKIFLELFLILI